MQEEMIRLGDPIIYRSDFGTAFPVLAQVSDITITDEPREKYGKDTTEAPWSLVLEDRICFGMNDGHWCYSSQIDTDILPSTLKKIMRDTKKNLPTYMGKHPALDVWITNKLKG